MWRRRPDLNRGWRFCRQGRDVCVVDSSCFLVGPTPPLSLVFGLIVPKLFPTANITRAWSVAGRYAYHDGEITQSISATAEAGAVLAQLPKHSLSFWNKYETIPRLAADLGLLYRGERTSRKLVRTDARADRAHPMLYRC